VPELGRAAPDAYYDEVMLGIEGKGIPYIGLYEPMLRAYRAHTPPAGFDNSILGTGHWNRVGHEVIAGEIIRFLEARDDLG
jgi:hypothetical protein